MKDLVVIFHDKVHPDMQDYLKMGNFGSGGENDWIAIREGGQAFGKAIENPDVIIISDIVISTRQDIIDYLKQSLNQRERIYVAYHSDLATHVDQKKIINKLAASREIVPREFQHIPREYPLYDAIISFVASRSKDNVSYTDALSDLVASFSRDLSLEAKLELLHKCLTPEGKQESKVMWQRVLRFFPVSECEQLQHLYDAIPSDKDCFSDQYVSTLRSLRDALLPDISNSVDCGPSSLDLEGLSHSIRKLIPKRPSTEPKELTNRIRDVLAPSNRSQLSRVFEGYLSRSLAPEYAILRLSDIIWGKIDEPT